MRIVVAAHVRVIDSLSTDLAVDGALRAAPAALPGLGPP